MKAALDGGSNFWNGGELYGTPELNSLHLLRDYFTKYPDDADKVVISIKGGMKPGALEPDGSRENVQRSINECLRVLDGKKSLDIFECARVDKKVPIEDTISYIAEFVKAGKLGGISLSEVSAQSIRRAAKVHPIACVEVEFSLYSTDILHNDIAQACGELGIPIVAYSPLGRGFLVSLSPWKRRCCDSNASPNRPARSAVSTTSLKTTSVVTRLVSSLTSSMKTSSWQMRSRKSPRTRRRRLGRLALRGSGSTVARMVFPPSSPFLALLRRSAFRKTSRRSP